jgi:hypothetical protein
LDPDIFQIILAGLMGMSKFVFAQYGVGVGIHLDLDITGTPAIDLLAVDLLFPHHFLLIMLDSSASVTRAMECLAG